jgi:hypothetical protein
MRIVILVSIGFGVIWNVIAVCIMGGRFAEAFAPSLLLAGAFAGIAAGIFTIWSRERREGRETFLDGVATYYLGMFAYWIGFLIFQRIAMCLQHGGWTDFDLADHFKMILIFLIYGTLFVGVLLIPLTFITRYVLWKLYTRNAA